MEYEKRIVCFMDLLGFKNMISDSTENVDIRDRIFNFFQELNRIYGNFHEIRKFAIIPERELSNGFNPKEGCDSGLQSEMSFFSDSIVFSYKLAQQREDLMDVYIVLHEISFFAFQLLSMGVFVRGGLSYGDLYHKDNICFGPALVKSVSLEETAVYPRISIDPLFFNEDSSQSIYYGKSTIITQNRKHLEDIYHCVDIATLSSDCRKDIWKIRKDDQLVHYLDILDAHINYSKKIALHIKAVIENELKKKYPPHIAEKYAWFKDYYNSIVYNTQCMEDVKIE